MVKFINNCGLRLLQNDLVFALIAVRHLGVDVAAFSIKARSRVVTLGNITQTSKACRVQRKVSRSFGTKILLKYLVLQTGL